jgi:hypothetical protein
MLCPNLLCTVQHKASVSPPHLCVDAHLLCPTCQHTWPPCRFGGSAHPTSPPTHHPVQQQQQQQEDMLRQHSHMVAASQRHPPTHTDPCLSCLTYCCTKPQHQTPRCPLCVHRMPPHLLPSSPHNVTYHNTHFNPQHTRTQRTHEHRPSSRVPASPPPGPLCSKLMAPHVQNSRWGLRPTCVHCAPPLCPGCCWRTSAAHSMSHATQSHPCCGLRIRTHRGSGHTGTHSQRGRAGSCVRVRRGVWLKTCVCWLATT